MAGRVDGRPGAADRHPLMTLTISGDVRLGGEVEHRITARHIVPPVSGPANSPRTGSAPSAETFAADAALRTRTPTECPSPRSRRVLPGVIDISNWDAVAYDEQELFRHVANSAPARRAGEPSDAAAAACAGLVDPYITGGTLHVDGGARWS